MGGGAASHASGSWTERSLARLNVAVFLPVEICVTQHSGPNFPPCDCRTAQVTWSDSDWVLPKLPIVYLPNRQDGSLKPGWDLGLVADPWLTHLQFLGFYRAVTSGLAFPYLRWSAPQRNLRDREWDHGADPIMG